MWHHKVYCDWKSKRLHLYWLRLPSGYGYYFIYNWVLHFLWHNNNIMAPGVSTSTKKTMKRNTQLQNWIESLIKISTIYKKALVKDNIIGLVNFPDISTQIQTHRMSTAWCFVYNRKKYIYTSEIIPAMQNTWHRCSFSLSNETLLIIVGTLPSTPQTKTRHTF